MREQPEVVLAEREALTGVSAVEADDGERAAGGRRPLRQHVRQALLVLFREDVGGAEGVFAGHGRDVIDGEFQRIAGLRGTQQQTAHLDTAARHQREAAHGVLQDAVQNVVGNPDGNRLVRDFPQIVPARDGAAGTRERVHKLG